MARPSPGTQRVIDVLNLLTCNRGKAFSLSEFISTLKMNRATAHSVVNALVDSGFLYRTRDKLYVLGPAAVELGRAAEMHVSPFEVAVPEMNALANRHDVICSALALEGTDIVEREKAVSVSHLDWAQIRLTRWPMRPPFGGPFLAWADDGRVDAWFDGLDPRPSAEERERTRAGFAFVRANGIQVVIRRMPFDARDQNLEWLYLHDPMQRPLEVATHLDPAQSYTVAGIACPVFERPEKVAFVLSMNGFSRAFTGAEVQAIGAELRAACDRIGRFSRG